MLLSIQAKEEQKDLYFFEGWLLSNKTNAEC